MYLEIIEILLRGFCVGVAASITVGPVAVLCIQRTLSKSRRSGIVSGLGVAAADTLMAMIAYFCYSMLQAQIDCRSVFTDDDRRDSGRREVLEISEARFTPGCSNTSLSLLMP